MGKKEVRVNLYVHEKCHALGTYFGLEKFFSTKVILSPHQHVMVRRGVEVYGYAYIDSFDEEWFHENTLKLTNEGREQLLTYLLMNIWGSYGREFHDAIIESGRIAFVFDFDIEAVPA